MLELAEEAKGVQVLFVSIAPERDTRDKLNEYVHLGPLAQAFSTPGSVLLLDEIDKAPRELPNNLLFLLSERRIVVPETQQTISCKPGEMPIIVITSNHEQDLPAPFIRRCIYAYIEFERRNFKKKK